MIYETKSNGTFLYRNLGLTSISPEPDHTAKVAEIAKAFNIPVTIIDPNDANSIGLNPFKIEHAPLCALIISSVLKSLYDDEHPEHDEAYMQNSAHQAIQNVVVLLKAVYPNLHNGDLPNLEDVLICLTNFDYTEELCEELKKDEELAKEHFLLISYFEQFFYKSSGDRETTKRLVHFATAQLDYMFKSGECRKILCDRNPENNLDYRDAITRGDVILLCTRHVDFGGLVSRGIARFFLMSLLRGMGDMLNLEDRMPHFLYMDGFDFYAYPDVSDLFTLGRKLKVGATMSAQNLAGIGGPSSTFMQSMATNAPTKLSFGNCTPEDFAWWENEFCKRREWVVSNTYDSSNEEYGTNLGNVQWTWKDNLSAAKIQGIRFKECVYKTKDKNGNNKVSFGCVDFLPSKYLAPHKSKSYDFGKYSIGMSKKDKDKENQKPKFDYKNPDFHDLDIGVDPIHTDATDSSYFFENNDAISFNLGGNKKN